MAMVRMDAHIAYVTMYKASSTKKESASPCESASRGSKASSKVTIEVTRPQIDHWVGVEYASVPMASGVSM